MGTVDGKRGKGTRKRPALKLTHVDAQGRARMVDVSGKAATAREAVAAGTIRLAPQVYQLVISGSGPKGDVLPVARIAGIMAAKKTQELVPLCHPIAITHVGVEFELNDDQAEITVSATVRTTDRTGVEMEAMTAAMVAALTVYDMLKAVDKGIELGPFYLVGKKGGKSGTYRRKGAP